MRFEPEKDYAGLLKQARAMHLLICSMEKAGQYRQGMIDNLSREIAMCGQEAIESERTLNQQLTNQVLALEAKLDAANTAISDLKKACNSASYYLHCIDMNDKLQERLTALAEHTTWV